MVIALLSRVMRSHMIYMIRFKWHFSFRNWTQKSLLPTLFPFDQYVRNAIPNELLHFVSNVRYPILLAYQCLCFRD